MIRFGVITKIPAPGDLGNLAMDADVFVDPQATGGSYMDEHKRLTTVLNQPMLGLFIQTPVFRLGELVVMVGERDQFGRKPSKWSVECEIFDDPAVAADRAREVVEAFADDLGPTRNEAD